MKAQFGQPNSPDFLFQWTHRLLITDVSLIEIDSNLQSKLETDALGQITQLRIASAPKRELATFSNNLALMGLVLGNLACFVKVSKPTGSVMRLGSTLPIVSR